MALVNPVAEHHAIEVQQVFGRGVKTPSRGRKHGSLAVFCRVAAQDAGRRARQFPILLRIHHGDPPDLVSRRIEKAVFHPQRSKDVPGDVVLILFPRADFDDAAEDLNARTGVAPLRARLKQQRLLGQLPDHFIQGHAHGLWVVADGRRPGIVLHTGGMGKQITDGDCMVGNAQACGVRVGRGGHAQAVEFGQILFYRVAQRELALFCQHHDADRRERLGHGHDLENSVLLHGMASFHISHAGSVKLHDVAAMGDKRNCPGDCLPIDERLHPLRNLRKDFLIHAARGVRQG